MIQQTMVGSGLSSREINRARRVARLVAKQKSRDNQEEESAPESKRVKVEPSAAVIVKQEETETPTLSDSVPDSTGSWGEVGCLFYNNSFNYLLLLLLNSIKIWRFFNTVFLFL